MDFERLVGPEKRGHVFGLRGAMLHFHAFGKPDEGARPGRAVKALPWTDRMHISLWIRRKFYRV